jgi:dipeptidyl aminopeptidase/acylaminoacyl peptidase
LFIAATQDDSLVPVDQSINIFDHWTKTHRPAELHVYERGKHGFGMYKRNLPVDQWTVAFEKWLQSDGWL